MEKENIFTLTDEEGNESEFELIGELNLDDNVYLALMPLDSDEEEYVILKIETDENGDELLDDVDYIVTGDLGKIGYEICKKQLIQRGYAVDGKYFDCGMEIYHAEQQDVHAGGSGCGCSAVVLGAGFLPQMKADVENRKRGKTTCRLLYVGTGALLSPVTVQQGESIPGIAHGVLIEYCPTDLQEV